MTDMPYDEAAMIRRLRAFAPGAQRIIPDMGSLSIFCQGDEEQLRRLVEPFPFELASTTILLGCTDWRSAQFYAEGDRLPYRGLLYAQAMLHVRHGDDEGGYSVAVFNDEWESIKGGAQVNGHYETPSEIAFEETPQGVGVSVTGGVLRQEPGELMVLGFEKTDEAAEPAAAIAWPAPYFTIRMLPGILEDKDRIDVLEVYSNEGGAMSGVEEVPGRGFVTVAPVVHGERLVIERVLGASFVKGRMEFLGGDDPSEYTRRLLQRNVR